jgi:zinc protease
MKRTFVLWLVLLLLAGNSIAQKKKEKATQRPEGPKIENTAVLPPPVKVTTVEGITEYRLANGLRVLLFPDQSKQTITVNITYMVGSKHENYGETGMAHLLEHLVFKGTPKYPTNIMKELEDRGARFNGTTWVDRTNYFETLAATDENLAWVLEMEADRMVNSFIAQKDLDTEMTVVRNEFESGENSPFRVLMQRVMSSAYDWHNYGKSTIGARSDIENVSIDRLQAFYRKYYQPDNAVLVVAGKFDEPKTLQQVNQYFGVISKPVREIQPFYTADPTQDGERTVTVRRVGDVQLVMAAYRIPPGSHADYAPVAVLSQILGSEPSGRLYKALIDTKKATSIYAFDFQWKEPGLLFNIAEVLKENSLDDAKNAMIKALDDVSKNIPTKEEVERAKTEIIKQTELMFNSSEQVGVSLSEAIGTGDWRLLHLTRDRIKAVTVEDVARVAQYYLKADNRTVGLFIPTEKPDRAEIPAAPNVDDLVKDYKGQQNVAQGEVFDPSPANIDARTSRITLPNGVKVAMLEKKTRGESVRMGITLRIGDETTLAGKSTAGSFTADMLNKGTSKLTRQQIKDEFDRLKANVSVYGSARIVTINIETTRPNLIEVINLATTLLKDPSFPADEFEKLKNEQLAGIESQRSEPQAIAVNRYQRHISPYAKSDPRYNETFDEAIASIKGVTLDDVKKFYKLFYGTTSGATISVVGDFDQAAIQKIITDTYGAWKSPAKYTRLESKVFPVQVINESIETPDKANAMFIAGYSFEMKDDNPDYAALVIGHYILGGGTASRLFTRIRGKEGLSYGVGSNVNIAVLDNGSSFTAYAIYAPENVTKLEATFMEEINKAVTDGFTAEEVEAAKSGWLQQRTVSRAQDAGLATAISNSLFLNRTLAWDEKVEKEVAGLTAEKINAAMKKHLDPAKINIVKAGDFAKAKAEEKK